jgi:hypothetical protein
MRILPKGTLPATALVAALLAASGCARLLPWRDQPADTELNLAFQLDRNLIVLTTVHVDHHPGRFILGTAAPRTLVDPGVPLSRARTHTLQVGEKHSLRISPARMDLGGMADAIVGADAWDRKAITIDYRTGLVTHHKKYGIEPGLMQVFPFDAEPAIQVGVDGKLISAIVDTTLPDTLVLPGAARKRGKARVTVSALDFGEIDVQYAAVPKARVGNRLLSRFLVTIDYGQRVVGLWHDPRIPVPGP